MRINGLRDCQITVTSNLEKSFKDNRQRNLVSVIRKITKIDPVLTAYDQTVNRNFQEWVFNKQAGTLKFNEDQMNWLRMIKEYIATVFIWK
nr:type I restriction-modification enzyme R subunit C-terminal domain-containing protein [Methanosarcina sp. UBA5]